MESWSKTLYDSDCLPFMVRMLRYPLLSTCYHIKQRNERLITILMAMCLACTTNASCIEEAQLHQDIIQALAALLEDGKEVSFEIISLMDQIRFQEQQPNVI